MFEVRLEGDLARRIDREARRRDVEPEELVAEAMALSVTVRRLARTLGRPGNSEQVTEGKGPP